MRIHMYFIWLVLSIVCLSYYIVCAAYAGIHSSFIFIWLIGTFFFGAMFVLRWTEVKKMIVFPHFLIYIIYTFIAICFTIFVIIETIIIKNMNSKPDDDCKYMIVLGCQIRGNMITKSLRMRLDVAYEYANRNPEVIIIVSGGKGQGENTSEAEAMYSYLTQKGIDGSRIIKEEQSTNTDENMSYSVQFIENKEDKVAIVTSNFHIFRAKLLARAKGLGSISAAASPSDRILLVNYMVREAIGVVKDFVVGNFEKTV